MASNMCLFPKLCDGVGFSNWKFRVKILLEERNLDGVLDMKVTTKKEDDAKARSIIVQCLSDRYLEYVKKCATAADMIQQLDKIFERKSVFNKLYLRKRLLALKCLPSDKLQDHFLKFDTMIADLEATGTKIDESDKICHLLLTLPNEYDTVITTLETMSDNKDLNIEFIKSRLLDAELKLKGEENKQHFNKVESSFISCYKCGQQGHISYNCKNSERFIPNREKSRGRNSSRSRGRGFRTRSSRGTLVSYAQGDCSKESTFIALSAQNQMHEENSIMFVVDSGATHNFVKSEHEEIIEDIEMLEESIYIRVANGHKLVAKKKGILRLECQNNPVKIEVLIVDCLSHNLLSVNKLQEQGHTVVFKKGQLKIHTETKTYYGERMGKLHVLKFQRRQQHYIEYTNSDNNKWHSKLGHLNRKGLAIMKLPYNNDPCDTCMKNKSTRLPFKKVEHPQANKIGELIHSDVSGPTRTPTKEGFRYFQTIIDDYSHFTQTYLMRNKSEAANNLIKYITEIELEKDIRIKRIRCDNGGEYSSNTFKKFCEQKGIKLEYSLPYSPQMNGKSERMNRTIYDKARTILDESNLPRYLWGHAILAATYLINRCPSKAIHFKIPAILFGREFNLKKLKIFGSQGWMLVIPRSDKFDSRAKEVRMIGYGRTGYKVWDPETDDIQITRDIRFNENNIRYDTRTRTRENQEVEIQIEKKDQDSDRIEDQANEEQENNERKENDNVENEPRKVSKDQEERKTRSGRTINKPKRLEEYELVEAYCLLNNEEEPQTYEEAVNEGWNDAIKTEIDALIKMNTWTVTNLPENKKAIDTKWIFKTKDNGMKKARLVARGFQMREHEDFGKNYAPVARISTVRMLLAHAVHNNYNMKQLDVPTAFLNGTLESEVYIKAPQGVNVKEGKVLKLNRGLYGLRESPKCWNQRFNDFVESKGFTRSLHDFCLYYGREYKVWMVIYVDDIILIGYEKDMDMIIKDLKREFHIKDFGFPSLFLGMEIEKKENTLKITQKGQIQKMLTKFNMIDCKSTTTPMLKEYQYDTEENIDEDIPYRQLIGGLMFIAMVSRPDIAYPVSYLSQYLDKPTRSLWTQAKRTLRYLKGTYNTGLTFKKSENNCLETYSDADWAGNHTDRKSVSGSVTLYNGCLVSWFSRKQTCVALSTVEAEYVAAAASACDLLYIKGLFSDIIGPNSDLKCILYMDNKGAIQLSKSFENSKRAKHIDIRYHFLKDSIIKKEISVEYISTNDNVSDMLTKTLSCERLSFMKNSLNIV